MATVAAAAAVAPAAAAAAAAAVAVAVAVSLVPALMNPHMNAAGSKVTRGVCRANTSNSARPSIAIARAGGVAVSVAERVPTLAHCALASFRVKGSWFEVWDSGFVLRFGVCGLGFGVWGLGLGSWI